MKIESKLTDKDAVFIAVFCLLAVERLFNVYEEFAKQFSEPLQDFKDILDQAYGLVFSSRVEKLDGLELKLEKLVPDSEEYCDVLANQAQCTVIGMMYLLEYIHSNDFSMAIYILQKVEESIDILGYEGGDQKKVLAKEENWQIELIEMLSSLSDLNRDSIRGIEKLNKSYAIPHV